MFFSQGEPTHHGVERLLQLLLQEQTAGRTLPLAVAASGGEEARQQHHQVPQRDLHRSAQPGGGGASRGPAGGGDVSVLRVTSRRSGAGAGGGSTCRDQGAACGERADGGCRLRQYQRTMSGTSSAKREREHARACVWDRAKAQLEEMSEKNGHMSVGRRRLQQDGGLDEKIDLARWKPSVRVLE